ncbi:MAG: polysulfide reductase NrfD [Planctomycetaceae bacterium]|nr:polysulfide reductase NrfD [Planctomycetaceae bacterium]
MESQFVFPNDWHVAWSIMIVLYPYITGLVAGAFVVSALYHVFHDNSLKPVSRLAMVTALCFCSCATMPLLLHLHQPMRAFNIMITPSATSAMAGFGFIYNLYMLLLVVEVWLIFRPEIVATAQTATGIKGLVTKVLSLGIKEITPGARAVDNWVIRALAIIGIPAACILHGYVGFLFGGIKANPWWSTAMMPVIFLISAVVSGIAALVLFYLITGRGHSAEERSECVYSLTRYLWIALIAAFALEMLELLHMAYEGSSDWHVIWHLLTHPLRLSYGVLQVGVGSLVPLLLLPLALLMKRWPRLMMTVSALASLLVLVQVFAMRWNVVIGGQLFSKSHRGFVTYPLEPMGREGLIAAIVVLVLPVVLLLVASKVLPVYEEKAAH